MKKRFLALLLCGMLAVSVTACGGNSEAPKNKSEVKEEVKEPTDLTGTWKSVENDGAWMEAVISDNAIEINWVSDGGDTKSIYWVGTYEAPTEYVEEYSWTSERDKEKTDSAILASTDDTKDFSYAKETLSYEASAMGTTKKVELTRE